MSSLLLVTPSTTIMRVLLSNKLSKFQRKVKGQTRGSQWSLGVTLIEILIVITILSLLGLAMLFAVRLQLAHTRDAQRKTHLDKLRVVFENYYNDNGCYPPLDIFFNGTTGPDASLCGQPLAQLQPYLDVVPCDPQSHLPYAYYSPNGKTICEGYRLYTQLEDKSDASISRVGCDKTGCGNLTTYNYGVSVGTNLVDTSTITPTPVLPGGPSPVPTGFLGTWVCSPDTDATHGNRPYCKEYSSPTVHGCGASFANAGVCGNFCWTGTPIVCTD
jgi:type II secretory pathway pseudopilin PulG